MCHKLVVKVLNMFKNFMRIFSPKYFTRMSRDFRETVVPCLCECREPVAAKVWQIYNAKFLQMSYNSRTTVLRKPANTLQLSGEKIKLSDIRTVKLGL